MKKALVAYFSASGVTQRLAKTVAEAAGADLFEIEPVQKYTSEDLDWTDKKSRSTLEMNDPSSRPAIAEHVDHMDQYDTVFVGFPIWWYEAPRIGMGKTSEILQKVCPAANVLAGRKMNASVSEAQVKKWMEEMRL